MVCIGEPARILIYRYFHVQYAIFQPEPVRLFYRHPGALCTDMGLSLRALSGVAVLLIIVLISHIQSIAVHLGLLLILGHSDITRCIRGAASRFGLPRSHRTRYVQSPNDLISETIGPFILREPFHHLLDIDDGVTAARSAAIGQRHGDRQRHQQKQDPAGKKTPSLPFRLHISQLLFSPDRSFSIHMERGRILLFRGAPVQEEYITIPLGSQVLPATFPAPTTKGPSFWDVPSVPFI